MNHNRFERSPNLINITQSLYKNPSFSQKLISNDYIKEKSYASPLQNIEYSIQKNTFKENTKKHSLLMKDNIRNYQNLPNLDIISNENKILASDRYSNVSNYSSKRLPVQVENRSTSPPSQVINRNPMISTEMQTEDQSNLIYRKREDAIKTLLEAPKVISVAIGSDNQIAISQSNDICIQTLV